MAQWLGCRTRNHKVTSSSPATAISSFFKNRIKSCISTILWTIIDGSINGGSIIDGSIIDGSIIDGSIIPGQ